MGENLNQANNALLYLNLMITKNCSLIELLHFYLYLVSEMSERLLHNIYPLLFHLSFCDIADIIEG